MCGGGEAHAQRNEPQTASQRAEQASREPTIRQAPYSTNYAERCQYPADHDEADLCQQWRAANAAEANTRFARLQYYASVAQSIGLVATLVLSAIAALLSLRAVQIAERDLTGRDRPVLSVQVSKVEWIRERVVVHIMLANIGQNPAVIDGLRMAIGSGRFAPRPRDAWGNLEDYAFISLPDAPVLPTITLPLQVARMRPFEIIPWRRAFDESLPQTLFLYGVITYRDQIPITRRKLVCISMHRAGKDSEGNDREYFNTLRGKHYDEDIPGKPDQMPSWWHYLQWEFAHWWGDMRDRSHRG